MNARLLAVVTCGLASLGTLAAQDRLAEPDPVPTRIETLEYGYDIGNPSPVQLECYLRGERATTLRVSGGEPGGAVVLLAADARDAIAIAGAGTLLVSPTAVCIPGVFDATGVFERRIEIDRKTLCGHSYFFQAVEVTSVPPVQRPGASWSALGIELSMGLEIRFLPGNPQPVLGYRGPRMTSIPCKDVGVLIPTMWSVLLEFETGGRPWAVQEARVEEIDRETSAILVVLRRGDGQADPAVVREVVGLGPFVKPRVEVWVAMPEPAGGCLTYARASEIHTNY